jgi:hypothetical protein
VNWSREGAGEALHCPERKPLTLSGRGIIANDRTCGVGVAVGSALWGGCDWGRGDVNINVNRYNNFNRTNITDDKWERRAEHRRGVQYRDSVSQQKYNRTTRTGGDAREAFRGRAEEGRQELSRGGGLGGGGRARS